MWSYQLLHAWSLYEQWQATPEFRHNNLGDNTTLKQRRLLLVSSTEKHFSWILVV